MAKVIEFYIPTRFRKPLKWAPQLQSGKLIEFCSQMYLLLFVPGCKARMWFEFAMAKEKRDE